MLFLAHMYCTSVSTTPPTTRPLPRQLCSIDRCNRGLGNSQRGTRSHRGRKSETSPDLKGIFGFKTMCQRQLSEHTSHPTVREMEPLTCTFRRHVTVAGIYLVQDVQISKDDRERSFPAVLAEVIQLLLARARHHDEYFGSPTVGTIAWGGVSINRPGIRNARD